MQGSPLCPTDTHADHTTSVPRGCIFAVYACNAASKYFNYVLCAHYITLVLIVCYCQQDAHQLLMAATHNVAEQQYADNTQLFVAFSNATLPTAQVRFEHCTADLDAGFCFNGLRLNPSKPEAILSFPIVV